MELKLDDKHLQLLLQDITQKGFQSAFNDWSFTHEVNKQVGEFLAVNKVADKISIAVKEKLSENMEAVIKKSVANMTEHFDKVFQIAVEQMIERMLIGTMLNFGEDKYGISKEEIQKAKKIIAEIK